jgi:hypothetical protein
MFFIAIFWGYLATMMCGSQANQYFGVARSLLSKSELSEPKDVV